MLQKIGILLIVCSVFYGCLNCLTIKEESLGNNIFLSEYDNVDRRILYSEDVCSGSGYEIVPMTVTEYATNAKWIIAKSRPSRFGSEYHYWIVNKDFKVNARQNSDNQDSIIQSNVFGPLDSTGFANRMQAEKIRLRLKKI